MLCYNSQTGFARGGVIVITVTKLNDKEVVINGALIEFIETTPDTTITLVTGRKLLVRESLDEVLRRIKDCRCNADATPLPTLINREEL
jgi:flagellar protein FlbD